MADGMSPALIAEAETKFGLKILHLSRATPAACMHPDTQIYDFQVKYGDYRQRLPSDCEFQEIADWLESVGLLASRQQAMGNRTHHVSTAPLERRVVTTGYHATRTVSVAPILAEGLKLGNRERSTSAESERIDQLGNIYIAENLGQPGDEAAGNKGTAHWWREHKATRNCLNDPDWSILQIDFSGLPDLRLYRDAWSSTGLILRSEISGDRIAKVA